MELENKTNKEYLEIVTATEDKDVLREVATLLGVAFSGNTGVDTLKQNILDQLNVLIAEEEAEETPEVDEALMAALNAKHEAEKEMSKASQGNGIPDLDTLVTMDPRGSHSESLRRAIVRAQALQLVRCHISNLDPNDAALPGAIITVYNKYTGKVSKYIPFGEENELGYHIPMILYKELLSRTFNMRKEIKSNGSSFGIKQYRTVKMPKFSVKVLEPLTAEELKNLADDQKARGAVDRSV